ncbi:MAG TPA: helicase-related protein, partial [Candidatus Saccharimonadales bacterium]|nr:helicase-related protein [Candidatus Saccharimonadales bacterium]
MSPTSFDTLEQLPIYERKQDILSSVDANQVTIITAETGAGKSTQVPQFLAEHGYRKIIVTQPRILAARNLSGRVRQEYSWRLGQDATSLVGYRTAMERDDQPDNTILYCTDGLQLVRELTGSGIRDKQVLVLDEIHEWNENMEVLIAWAKKRCQEDPGFKVVLMSATIEADKLAAYFGAQTPISVPGRTFPVIKKYGTDVVTEITTLLGSRTSNMLVFLPGKAEIEAVAEAIQKTAKTVPIIPLHSQLTPEEQQRAFASYPQGKVILTTNVAQTSITIDDIDIVIDSGLERRAEVRSGVEGLFIAQISQADCLQRAGRAGRTKEGLYILAPLDSMPCAKLEERPPYGVPEIMRKHIDRLVLRLANIGIDIETLDFYHNPSTKTIKLAK